MTNKKTSFMFVVIGVLFILLTTYCAQVYSNYLSPLMWFVFPILLIILSCLMFLGGYYYHRFKSEEVDKTKDLQKEAIKEAIKKMGGNPSA
ncbi:hypothetical protein HY988_01835 [Candidatus Micrarchaeota archaeon]|nr:hypothetical protein [Candidatus Micrarchaeota archaeon]